MVRAEAQRFVAGVHDEKSRTSKLIKWFWAIASCSFTDVLLTNPNLDVASDLTQAATGDFEIRPLATAVIAVTAGASGIMALGSRNRGIGHEVAKVGAQSEAKYWEGILHNVKTAEILQGFAGDRLKQLRPDYVTEATTPEDLLDLARTINNEVAHKTMETQGAKRAGRDPNAPGISLEHE